ncbi:MAG: hypothetical protein IPK26_10680 [Planctomycetes bacterium]|nr:hypothetical protein [Planctomycetota bacterium]
MRPPFLSSSAAAALLASVLAAQSTAAPAPDIVRVSGHAGLHVLDGDLIGVGDRYKARFDAGTIVFTPVFGRAAPATRTVRLSLSGVGRGRTTTPVAAVPPTFTELSVRYEHAACTESYDVRADGLEQSFRFASLPAGEGDLVVRLRLQSELSVAPQGDGLRFTYPGVGSFDLGAVTGIDDAGERCAGSMRLVGDELELSLPAPFVDRARLPLVLDPFLGALFHVVATTSIDEAPRTAYSFGSDRYLVVWMRNNSATDVDVLGQRIARNGAPVGGVLSIAAQPGRNFDPAVASIRVRDGFLVAYVRNDDVLCRSVSAATGAVSLSTILAGGADVQRAPDLGGEATLADDDGVCVWADYDSNSIHSVEVGLNADFSVAARGSPRVVFHDAANAVVDFPRIAKSGGTARRYGMTCYVQQTPPGNHDVLFFVLDDTGATMTALFVLDNSTLDDIVPTCDGDGSHWTVAWERVIAGISSIQAASLSYLGGGTVLPYRNGTPTTLSFAGRLPAVTWIGQSCLVSWFERNGNTATCRLLPLEPWSFQQCEASRTIAAALDLDFTAYGAATASGGNPIDEALFALATVQASTGNSDIQGQEWQARDGFSRSLGGGCGQGGEPFAPCLLAGSFFASLRLRAASPSRLAALVIGRDRIDLPCGTCALVPDPATGVILAQATDLHGDLQVPVSLPTGSVFIGMFLYAQWLVFDPTPGCAPFGASFSPAQVIAVELPG